MDETQTHILGTKLDLYERRNLPGLLSSWLQGKRLRHLVTLNPEIALYAEKHENYRRQILNKADLTVRDGAGLVLGGCILGTRVPARVTGRQLMSMLLTLAQRQKKRIYLLGGAGDTAVRAAENLKSRFPHLEIVGAESGPQANAFTFHDPELIERINVSKADLLFVAYGAPKQEQWIAKNREMLRTVKIAVGVGGVFDYLSGNVSHPPQWVQKVGLEWLYRLVTQKQRVRRVFHAIIIFPLICIYWRLRILFVFRMNVVGAITNRKDELLLVTPSWSRIHKWQFPQGGVDKGENADQAILREMKEELGTGNLIIKKHLPGVYRYIWPKWYQLLRGYKGQKQDLYYLEFEGSDSDIEIERKELAAWRWVSEEKVLATLAPSRKQIGEIVLKNLH